MRTLGWGLLSLCCIAALWGITVAVGMAAANTQDRWSLAIWAVTTFLCGFISLILTLFVAAILGEASERSRRGE